MYETELIYRRAPWKTRESVELTTLEWAAWYNHCRLMEPLGYLPPAEAEASYYRQLTNAAAVPALACIKLKPTDLHDSRCGSIPSITLEVLAAFDDIGVFSSRAWR